MKNIDEKILMAEEEIKWSSVKISDNLFEKIPVRYATACCANSSVR